MTARQLSQLLAVVVAVVLLGYCDGAAPRVPQPKKQSSSPCNSTETSLLFSNCLLSFGLAHLHNKGAMKKASSCLTEMLDCDATATAIECIQGLQSQLSFRCKANLRSVLSDNMMEHFNCNYLDVECKCWRTIYARAAAKHGQANVRRTIPSGCPPQ